MTLNADGTPDWPASASDLHCPLCGYNLRGLTDPRCPECGYAFAWAELLDARRSRHPWLFEHHPSRPLWAFAKTLWVGLWPRRFWALLDPLQPPRVGWLLVYWATAVLLLGLAAVGWAAWDSAFREDKGQLGYFGRHWPRGVLRNLADAVSPKFNQPIATILATAWTTYVGWCAATFAALLIFQESMRRASVKVAHILRAVVYSFDVAAWAGLALLAAGLLDALLIKATAPFRREGFEQSLICAVELVLSVVVPAVVTYRLTHAFRHYLRFDRAGWVILTTQVIVGLLGLLVYLYLTVE